MSRELRYRFDEAIYVPVIKGNNSNLILSGGDNNHVIFEGIIDFSTATHPDGSSIGDVTGPNSSTSNAIVKFSNTTGKIVKNSLVTISDSGNLRGTALHNNPDDQGDATEQDIRSGTYTPSLTNVANVTSSQAYTCQWFRVGNVVTVSGRIDLDTIADSDTLTQLGISLPVDSTFASNDANECSGIAVATNSANINNRPAKIDADVLNSRAQLSFLADEVGTHSFSFNYTYVVL